MSEKEIIKNRSEIVFFYDITDGNPNGDPADSNKPRIDEATGINIVTDVRLKRTIRDYLMKFKKREIFVKKVTKEDGTIYMAKDRARDFENNPKKILDSCIDVRLFGGTIPITEEKAKDRSKKDKKGSITLIGPVQFNMGRSLHKVELKYIKGTGAFAAKEKAKQQTFREEYILPYSFIAFHGLVNENAALDVNLTEDDVILLLESIWFGTKNLITRSKMGHEPRLLLQVIYREKSYHIGDLHKHFQLMLNSEIKEEENIRSILDFTIDISQLKSVLEENKDKILSIHHKIDENLTFQLNNELIKFEKLFESLNINHKELDY